METRFEGAIMGFLGFGIFFLAAWAVMLQIGVQLGIRFALVPWLLIPAALAGLLGIRVAGSAPGALPDAGVRDAPQRASARVAGLLAVMVASAGTAFAGIRLEANGSPGSVIFFGVLLTALAVGLWLGPRGKSARIVPEEAPQPPSHMAVTVLMGLCLLVLPLLFHRGDTDDAHYLNMSVGMMVDPRPILTFDTLLGDPAQPLFVPTYRVEVHQALLAALSAATGVRVIEVAHLLWPPFAALLLFLSLRLMCRQFAGKEWLLALLICLSVLFVYGFQHQSYGNFSFMRLQQAKSIVFVALPPLIYVFALRFWQHGRAGDWMMLAAIQAAGTGLSANAIFLNAFTLLIVGLALFSAGPAQFARLVLLGLSGFWTVAVALLVLLTTGAVEAEYTFVRTVLEDVEFVLDYRAGGAFVGLLFASWLFLDGWLRRFMIFVLAFFTLIVLNPFIHRPLAEALTGNLNWRLFFALPVPALLGIALAKGAVQVFRTGPARRALPWAAAAVLLLAAFGPTSILDERNRTFFEPFGLDVTEGYSAAVEIERRLAQNAVVLAPVAVASWLSTFESLPSQVGVHIYHFHFYAQTRSETDVAMRFSALRFATSGPAADMDVAATLASFVETFGVTDFVLDLEIGRAAEMAEAARSLGFAPVWQGPRFQHFQK
jgi:hypothetical protein